MSGRCIALFGFLTRDDLEIFRLLIGVSGIGPKGGLSILSKLTADDLRFAVLYAGDAKAISSAPGIGEKTAQKVMIQLKDKLDLEEMLEPKDISPSAEPVGGGLAGEIQTEAVQALVALGYGSTESLRAVKKVDLEQAKTVEDVLKQALKNLF